MIVLFLFVVWITTTLVMYWQWINFDSLFSLLGDNQWGLVLAFIAVYVLRNYLLIPPTVLVLLWWVLFHNIQLAFVVAMIGGVIGLIETYRIGVLINENSQKNIMYKTVKPMVSKAKKFGFWFVALGCVFPLFPTDVICYTAWFIRYDFKKFLLAWTIGIIPLTLLYTRLGEQVIPLIDSISIYGWALIIVISIVYGGRYYYKENTL